VLSRPAPPPDFTVTYGDHPDHVADIRLPSNTARVTPAPLVLFLHGGFWRHQWDRAHTGPLAADLAERGYAVAIPEYRRTGADGGWPGTFDDVRAAARMVPSLAAASRPGVIDIDRVILAGHSAGGHLALWAAADPTLPAVGVVALAPVSDLRAAYELDLDRGAVRALLGGGPADVPERYAATDPMGLMPVAARVVVLHGVLDLQVPVEMSRRFVTAARAAGGDVTLHELVDIEHFGLIDPASAAWPAVLAAFRTVVRPGPGVDAHGDSR
jgi:acetyl esterase/lipase